MTLEAFFAPLLSLPIESYFFGRTQRIACFQVQLLDRLSITRNVCQILIHEAKKTWFRETLERFEQLMQLLQQRLAKLGEDEGAGSRGCRRARHVKAARFYQQNNEMGVSCKQQVLLRCDIHKVFR